MLDPQPDFLKTQSYERIAYIKREALSSRENTPEIVFLGGYASDMTGTKAAALDEFARAEGLGLLRFDYRGHGASDGEFTNYGIGDWYADAQLAIETLTNGPIVLIGSSMGGWLANLFARDHPHKVKALIGIAAAPDFTEDFFWSSFSEAEKAQIEECKIVERPSGYETPYKISPALIKQGREHLIMRTPLRFKMPVRYFQGMSDQSVSNETAMALANHAEAEDLQLRLIKNADHSFSRPEDLELIFEAILRFTP